MPRRILVIFNPAAGRGRRRAKRLSRVVAELERLGCLVTVLPTRAPRDAERLAREADLAFDLIVAAGGDGTVNEVANGIFPVSRPLAVLPLGTGNVLANEIGLPRDPQRLARVIADGRAKPIWPGRAGDRLFLAMTGVGFDAEVLGALDPRLKHRIGKLGYIWAILLCLCRYRQGEFVVRTDGGAYRAASAIVTLGRLYAGRFIIAPDARLDVPLLHIVLFRRAGRLAVLRYLGAMLLGRLHRRADVSIVTARRASVAAGEPAPAGPSVVETDGEIRGRLPLAIEIAARPLLVVQPGRSVACDQRNRTAAPLVSPIANAPPGNSTHFSDGLAMEESMLYWALVFLIIAVIAGFLGFGGVAFAAAGIAKILFFIFLVIFAIALVTGFAGRRRPPI